MQHSIIQKSQLESAHRLDAEYYQPEYLNLMNNFRRVKNINSLKNITKQIVSGSYIDRYFNEGSIYLRVNNITDYGFDLSDVKFVDIEFSKFFQKSELKLVI